VDKIIRPYKSFFESNFTPADLDYNLKDENLRRMARYLVGMAANLSSLDHLPIS
jgi:hypothetical protein